MYKQYTLRSLVLIQSPSTQSHQVSIPSPLTSSTSAQIQKSIMTSSTPNPSQMRRTSGSSGIPDTPPCIPTQNTTPVSGIAASPPKAGQSAFSTAFPPPPSTSPTSSTHIRPTHIPPSLHRWYHLWRLRSTTHLRPCSVATPPQVYADVEFIQISDLDRLWCEMVDNPSSRFEVLSYDAGGIGLVCLTNYFIASGRNNPFLERCHRLLLTIVGCGRREDKYGGDA